MNNFSLEAMLRAAGKRMRDDLAGRLIPHPAELGTDRGRRLYDSFSAPTYRNDSRSQADLFLTQRAMLVNSSIL